jgi:membrane-bound metal-dependent hydrolase YbcI (DUF457 family)
MVLGHAAVTAAAHHIGKRRWPTLGRLSLCLLILGAYLPDLLDKPLSLLLGLAGRGYAHSAVVQAAVLGVAWLLWPRWRAAIATLWLGASLHLLQDWATLEVLVAPLLGPIPAGRFSVSESVLGFYTSGGPLLWVELAALAYWLAVALRRGLPSASRQPAVLSSAGES